MWQLDCEESWAQNWCFWTVVLEKTLRVPWTTRRSSQSILKEISPGCSLERMMLKLKLQYFGHLMQRVDSLQKTLLLGGIGGRRRRGWQRMRWLNGITDSMDVSLSELREWGWTGRPGVLRFMGFQRVGHDWATELNWTELTLYIGAQWERIEQPSRRCRFDPRVGKIPWRRKWQLTPFCLENPLNRGAWWATVCGVTKESVMTEQLNNSKTLYDNLICQLYLNKAEKHKENVFINFYILSLFF